MLQKYDVRNKTDIHGLRVNDRLFFGYGEVRMLPLRMVITGTQGYQHKKPLRSLLTRQPQHRLDNEVLG